MKFANPRIVWKDYIFKVITEAKKNKKEVTIFVHYHQNNSVPAEYKINETAAKFDFDFNSEDTIDIDDVTTSCSGLIDGNIYVFNFADIIQLTKISDVENKIDQKLIDKSRSHLKFK